MADYIGFGVACLERNLRLNKLQNVEVHRKAVSGEEGEIVFYYDPSNPGSLRMSTIRERMSGSYQKVDAVPLSKYIDREVDFLKLDVEGVEKAVIKDLKRENKLVWIREMAIEYHHHIHKDDDTLSEMLKDLEDAGFGYQISGSQTHPFQRSRFQDILVYAYRKALIA